MSGLGNQIDWSTAPEDAQFYSAISFRKHGSGEEYHWTGDEWAETFFETIREHERYLDFQRRPTITSERMDEILSEAMDKAIKDTSDNLSKAWCGASYDLGQPVGVLGEQSGAIKYSIDFLDEVKSIQSQRAAEYEQDGGERSFAKVATVFNTYTGKNLEPSDVALLLEILKNVRFYSQDGYHSDSVIDKISYASLWAELVTEERT